MGKRERRRKFDIPVMFEVWVEDNVADVIDTEKIARLLSREGIEGVIEMAGIVEAKGTSQPRKVRKHARKTHGISNTIPDKDWITRVMEAEDVKQFRVQIGTGSCAYKGMDKAILVERDCAEATTSASPKKDGMLSLKVEHRLRMDDGSINVQDHGRAREILVNEGVSTVYLTPTRFAILHWLAHRSCCGHNSNWHASHDYTFWLTLAALAKEHIPQCATPEAQVLDALEGGRIVS